MSLPADAQNDARAGLPRPREGWDEAYRAMAAAGDDTLVDGDLVSTSKWDEEEWEW